MFAITESRRLIYHLETACSRLRCIVLLSWTKVMQRDDSSDRTVYEVLESEAWEDQWNDVGLYWTKEQAEAEIERRRKKQRAESSLPEDEFKAWWNWTIHKKTLFGSSR